MGLEEDKRYARQAGTQHRDIMKNVIRTTVFVVVGLLLVALPMYKFASWKLSSETEVATPLPPASQPVVTTMGPGKAVVAVNNRVMLVRDPNTSDDCPGRLSPLEELTKDRVSNFNPRGCRFYARGTGTVTFTGLFLGEIERDISKSWDTGPRIVYEARATSDPVKWRYILCAGPKERMDKDDCS
ncbi:MAG TPA: hypothetical protein VJJ20_03625 [Candidatus Paceibacterota bacterium]